MGSSEGDVEALRLAREEARLKLDHEIHLVYETDDTALRTVRTAVVVLGVLVSAAGIAGPETIRQLPSVPLVLAIVGGASLLVCVFTGIGVLASSDLAVGVASAAVDYPVTTPTSERIYLERLLDSYRQWVGEMVLVRAHNSARLLVVLGTFLIGIVGISSAAAVIILLHLG